MDKWFVRKKNGNVCGPVEENTFKIWISQGQVGQEDEVRRETENEWKKLQDSELATADSTTGKSFPATAPADKGDLKTGCLIGFGIINTLLGLFMWFGGILRQTVAVTALPGDGSFERFLRGAVAVGNVVLTAFWFPLAVSGVLILLRKSSGRRFSLLWGQVLIFSIPISTVLTRGFRVFLSLEGLIIIVIWVYILLMIRNLGKTDFDTWFVS